MSLTVQRKAQGRILTAIAIALTMSAVGRVGRAQDALPPGVKAVWNLNAAHREWTPTRERVCINGLWR